MERASLHLQRFDLERFPRHLRRLAGEVTPNFRPKHAHHPNLQRTNKGGRGCVKSRRGFIPKLIRSALTVFSKRQHHDHMRISTRRSDRLIFN